MIRTSVVGLLLWAGLFTAQQAAGQQAVETVDAIEGIGPSGPWRRLGTGFLLSEAPAVGPGGDVYFSDFRGDTVYRIDPDSLEVTPFLEDIRAGGLAFDRDGRMIVLEGGRGAVLRVDPATRTREVIAGGIDGRRFNAPNDLVLDDTGGFYFSDPSNGAPLPLPQGRQSIYYFSQAGEVTRVIDYLPRPNGLALSNDGRHLLVALSGNTQILDYTISAPGVVSRESRLFADTRFQPPPGRGQGAVTGTDGLKTDREGNVYAATRFGIEVFTPEGVSLGVIEVPERPSNLAFAGQDGRILFVTTYDSIYLVPMAGRGAE